MAKKGGARGKGKKLTAMNTDEFLEKGLETSSGDDEEASDSDEHAEENTAAKKAPSLSSHKRSLEKLKQTDPEFYKFLQDEDDELLNFESSGEESEAEEEEEEEGSEEENDLSDEEAEEKAEEEEESPAQQKKSMTKEKTKLVTHDMIKKWSQSLQEVNSLAALHKSVMAFKAAVESTGSSDTEKTPSVTEYKVEGSDIFNAVVRLCLTDVLPMVDRVLQLPKTKKADKPPLPSNSKQWGKVKVDMRSYLTNVVQLLSGVAEASVVDTLLKHVRQLVPYYCCLPKQCKAILKKLINIWSTGKETSRILAFLSINRLVQINQESLLEPALKQMYVAYIKNSKFTSPTTLPLINFMKRSLVEIFGMDVNLTYQYVFVYIRQLAIHLRNAITLKKKDSVQAVYNWQYMHSLNLWVSLLSTHYPNAILEPLIYPLTQTIIGTIKLVPSARYYPLRFQCIRSLSLLSESTKTFVPILPFLIEVLEMTDFNKKPKTMSFKPINFACILKLSNGQLQEKAFKDGVIEQVYELLLVYLHANAHTVGFPELVLPAVVEMKQFLKKCKVGNYSKQIKQILDKVEETSKTIIQRRKTATLNIADGKAVASWEVQNKQKGTPLSKFYATWRTMKDRELGLISKGQGTKRQKDPVEAGTPKKKAKMEELSDEEVDEDDDDAVDEEGDDSEVDEEDDEDEEDAEDQDDEEEKSESDDGDYDVADDGDIVEDFKFSDEESD